MFFKLFPNIYWCFFALFSFEILLFISIRRIEWKKNEPYRFCRIVPCEWDIMKCENVLLFCVWGKIAFSQDRNLHSSSFLWRNIQLELLSTQVHAYLIHYNQSFRFQVLFTTWKCSFFFCWFTHEEVIEQISLAMKIHLRAEYPAVC